MENLNSVCYVTKINEIKQIEGADKIELIVAGGWKCISKKDEYKIGDLVLIATTDAVIPQNISDEIGVTSYLRKGGRVKTIKLKSVFSECLIIPFEQAKKATNYANTKWDEGECLMDTLKIFKYEPPIQMIQLSSGRKYKYKSNPNFSIYYKFPNLKNIPGLFTEEDRVQITLKIHGSNARFGLMRKEKLTIWDKFKKLLRLNKPLDNYSFVIGSHNVEKGSDDGGYYGTNIWFEIANEYSIKEKLYSLFNILGEEKIGEGIILYGEIFGPGIQKNYTYLLDRIKFEVFDIKMNGEYLPTFETESLTYLANLTHVPILYEGNWSQEIQDKFTFDNYITGTKIPHEGIVIKHISGNRHKVAKVISPEYLIYGEKMDIGDSH